MKIKKKAIIILLTFILILSMPLFNYNVKAIVDGDWYLCDLQIHPLDTKDFIESVSGNKWLDVEGKSEVSGRGVGVTDENSGALDLEYAVVNWWAPSTNYVNDCWWNITVPTVEISYHYDYESSTTATWSIQHYFRRSNGDQVLRIYVVDPNDTGNQADHYVYNSADALVASWDMTQAGHFTYNITLNVTTSEINVQIDEHLGADSTIIDVWFSASNFDYITSVFYDVGGFSHYTWEIFMDDFKINMAEETPEYLWDIESEFSSGCCVVCEYDTSTTLSFADTTEVVVETDYKNYPEGLKINQVALAVDSDSDLSTMDSWLRIGDTYQEERTQYYTYGTDYYIIVWEDINLTWTNEEVPFEFKFIRNADTDEIIILNKHSDLDGDGDIRFKYSMDADNYNGLYDGDTSLGRDLCYEIWYGYGGLSGDVNISVYNESNLSEALVNWSVTIVNRITGFIEHVEEDCTNPTVINTTDYGLGERLFIIENESYYPRTYWADIVVGVNYTLDAYLAPISESEIYCLWAIEDLTEYGEEVPIPNAHIIVRKYINASVGYINISNTWTNYNGVTYVPLIPGETYHFWVSKDGYQSEYTNFIVAANKEDCYTFKLAINFTDGGSWDKWYENITLEAEMVSGGYNQLGNVTIYYYDINGSTINTDCYLYEIYNDTTTYMNYSHNTSNLQSYKFGDVNTTRTHLIYFWYNNTASFIDQISPVVIVIDPIHVWRKDRVRFSFDTRVKNIIGPLIINGVDIGWHNAIAIAIGFAVLCLLGPFHVGVAMIGAGLAIGFTQGMFALWFTDVFPVLLPTLAPIFVVLGALHIKSTGGFKL